MEFFSAFDEIMGMSGMLIFLLYLALTRKMIGRELLIGLAFFYTFIFFTLFSSVIFRYQNYRSVLADLIVNLKFVGAFQLGVTIVDFIDYEDIISFSTIAAKISTVVLFVCTVMDILFNCFPTSAYR